MSDEPWGRLTRDGEAVVLEFSRLLPALPEQVWAALTDPERMVAWFGTWTGDPELGRVTLFMTEGDPDGPGEGVTIHRCRANELLDVEVGSPDGPWPLRVALAAEPGGAGTVLTFRHRLAEPVDASSIGPGWQYYLDRLVAVVTGTPVPDDWDAYYPVLADRYRALTC